MIGRIKSAMASRKRSSASPITKKPSQQSQRPKHDWTLPASIIEQLSRPVEQVIAQLIPLSRSAVTASPPPPPVITPVPANPFVDAFRGVAGGEAAVTTQPAHIADAATEKGGHAFKSTQSALVDLFFDLAPPTDPIHLRDLLEQAWKEDSLATTRLIFQTRSIHEGKGYKEGFWMAAGWLWEKHPRTFLENLHILVDPTCKREKTEAPAAASKETGGDVDANLAELPDIMRPHGTFDDLLDLLILHLNGQLNASIDKVPTAVDEALVPQHYMNTFKADRVGRKAGSGKKRDRAVFRQIGVEAKKQPDSLAREMSRCGTKEAKHRLLAGRLETALKNDIKSQALYCAVVDIFVKHLKADLNLYDKHRSFLQLPLEKRTPFHNDASPHLFAITYAAKWAPTPAKSADRQLHIASAIAILMFPGEGVNLSRERFQREVLSPLRGVLNVPESKMRQGEWRIDYTKVPSRAMSRYTSCFLQHDPVGFEKYLNKVAQGKASMSGAALFPHEILMDALSHQPIVSRVGNLQWRSLVDKLKASSPVQLQGSLAIADVSGSMGNFMGGNKKEPQPINVCLAMTLLLGELAAAPWSGMFFTFSATPSAEFIDLSKPLSDRVNALVRAHWGMSTNFYKVFDLILATATANQLKPEDMVKRLFIFSDMQFDQCAVRQPGDTEYAAIKRKYEAAGYAIPEVIFWNLAPREAGAPKPVRGDQEGVSLLSGYSGAMMKYFLRNETEQVDEELAEAMASDWDVLSEQGDKAKDGAAVEKKARNDPITTVRNILAAECFKGVVVVD